jgi:S-disulfanyl-L-cysteine oxidoreductase SoxD
MTSRLTAVVLSVTAMACAVFAQDAPTALSAGVYTEAQAGRGQKAFASQCARCHEPTRFTDGFMEAWTGETALALFDTIRTTMPEDNPKSLRPQQYADVLAYILSLNRYPAGTAELAATAAALKIIRIDAPKPQAD